MDSDGADDMASRINKTVQLPLQPHPTDVKADDERPIIAFPLGRPLYDRQPDSIVNVTNM